MERKYIVRLTDSERETLKEITKKLKGSSEKVRRANILLMADVDGPNWPDQQIAEAFSCWKQTVECIRKRLVERGFQEAVHGKVREGPPPRSKSLDGRQEAELIALRLGEPPKGFSSWSLRLLARKAVELELVDTISYETVRKTLKKTESPEEGCSTG